MTVRPGRRIRLRAGARPADSPPSVVDGRRRGAELVGSWRAALRIARRETRRARGRTGLVLAMITLPVLVLTFIAASYDMSELTRDERISRQLGIADAKLNWVGGAPVVQDEWGEHWFPRDDEGLTTGVPPTTELVTQLLGPGSRAAEVRGWIPVDLRVDGRTNSFVGRALDLTDPLARGAARLQQGRAPLAADEIAASRAGLRDLHARLGDTVLGGGDTYRVVGVVEFPDDLGPLIALHPSAVAPPEPGATETSWLVDLPKPLDADLVQRLNERGLVVVGHAGGDERPFLRAWPGAGTGDMSDLGTGGLISGLGLLEVVLLVGPAFAVGVRRRRRDLALVAVAGGDAAQLRRVVLADGVVLGVLGAAAGLLLGVAAAFAARPLVEQYIFGARFGGYRCWPVALVTIGGVAVLAGVLAALAPAWTAARQDVVAGLAGRRTPPRGHGRWLALGSALTAGGALIAAFGATQTRSWVILIGLILGELGLVFCTPTLIGLLARLGRALPLAPRIALRDASRNRSSAAPAISAVMAAVAASVALGTYLASDSARDAENFQPGVPDGTAQLFWTEQDGRPPPLAEVASAARAHLGADTVAPLDFAGCDPAHRPLETCSVEPVLPPEQVCPWRPGDGLSVEQRRLARADPRCQLSDPDLDREYFQVLVDDGTTLPVLTGASAEQTAAATAVLRAGGAVVTDPRYLHRGSLAVAVDRTLQTGGTQPTARTVSVLTGYALSDAGGPTRLLLSPAAATRLGLTWYTRSWAIPVPDAPDEEQQQRLVDALRPYGEFVLDVNRDRPFLGDPRLLLLVAAAGMITVGAAGIATGLAAAEGRADLSTLGAVGASPRVRRMLALCQAGVIAGLGSVLGIVAGLGTAVIILASRNRQYADTWPIQDPYPLVAPWATLGVLVVVPLVAMLGAGLFTRSRLPIERRLD
ncbi:FtsX-like permease family protein [Micromonospora sp. NPDC005367]|uniref:FtsX-like permease family protein n=1 Tax=Micromonospora sp. NPDC005367 TaxID=3155590 RepID=UPI0033B0025E